jgi:tight adherence protein C
MYSFWLLVAAGILAAIFALKKLRQRRKNRRLKPFALTEARTGTSADSVVNQQVDTVHSGLKNLAERSDKSAHQTADSLPESIAAVSNAGSEFSNVHSGDSQYASPLTSNAPAVAVPMFTADRHDRLSTWNDRRLFTDFRGILNEDADAIRLPVPEELPIQNDDFVFGSMTPAIAQLLPETDARRDSQRKNLIAAGYHSRASWLNLASIRFVLSFLAMVVVGFWLIVAPPALEVWLIGLLVAAPLFLWAIPPLLVAFKATERKADIERGLPDVLDMMNMGVSQGLTVPQSLKRIGREIKTVHPALAEELHIVNQQAEVGSLPQALKNLSQRIESADIASFTSLLIQSEATGTSISKALTDYSDSIRASLKERADARANAASFQLLFPVTLLLMPAVFLLLLGPAIVQMTDFFNNQGAQLQRDRATAVRSLDQQPQLQNRSNVPGGALNGAQQ